MRTIRLFIYKEFRQLFRNRVMLPLIFAMPLIQLVVLAYAADFEVKHVRLHISDLDQSGFSQRLTGKFLATQQFTLAGAGFSEAEGERLLDQDRGDLLLRIPAGFERDLMREGRAQVQLVVHAVDGVRGSLGNAYATQVIQLFNRELAAEYGPSLAVSAQLQGREAASRQLDITWTHWFNPRMDYKTFMVPGILAMLITMVGSFLSSMNVVREKEIGTIEQLNVTPIYKYQFIIGKLFPYWLLGLVELAMGLLLARLLYQIPIEGSLPLLFLFAAVYLLVVLGIGLLISASSDTQQQAMFIVWFFIVIFIFLSGMFTAVENMPAWAQQITYLNPLRYFIEAVRMILLKGSTFADLSRHFGILLTYAALINTLAVWRYRKRA